MPYYYTSGGKSHILFDRPLEPADCWARYEAEADEDEVGEHG